MPRIPRPWYRGQTKSWYVKLGGVQHPLGRHDGPPPSRKAGEWRPVPAAVEKAYHRLMAGEGLARPTKDVPLAGLVE